MPGCRDQPARRFQGAGPQDAPMLSCTTKVPTFKKSLVPGCGDQPARRFQGAGPQGAPILSRTRNSNLLLELAPGCGDGPSAPPLRSRVAKRVRPFLLKHTKLLDIELRLANRGALLFRVVEKTRHQWLNVWVQHACGGPQRPYKFHARNCDAVMLAQA